MIYHGKYVNIDADKFPVQAPDLLNQLKVVSVDSKQDVHSPPLTLLLDLKEEDDYQMLLDNPKDLSKVNNVQSDGIEWNDALTEPDKIGFKKKEKVISIMSYLLPSKVSEKKSSLQKSVTTEDTHCDICLEVSPKLIHYTFY